MVGKSTTEVATAVSDGLLKDNLAGVCSGLAILAVLGCAYGFLTILIVILTRGFCGAL